MSRTKYWYVNCDACGEEGTGGEGSRPYGEKLAVYMRKLRQDGWRFGKMDICPNCNGNAEPVKPDSKQTQWIPPQREQR